MLCKPFHILTLSGLLALGFAWPSQALNEGETVVLRYTYKADQVSVTVIKDAQGRDYLPLLDLTRFFGVQVDFDSQSHRLTLSKGKNKLKVVLSQPVYLVMEPETSFPIDPLEMISGQLGIPPRSAEDLIGTVLAIPVHFKADQDALVAGGVTGKEIQQEILAEKSQATTPTPQPASSAAAGPTPVGSPAAAPSLAQAPKEVMEPSPLPTRELPPPIARAPRADQVEKVRRIIIDAGHGGYDAGAPGYDHRFHEKAATLDIAKRLVDFLKEERGLEVLMTRKDDHFISLKYRSEFANSHNGDLFVSIHCNSNPRKGAHGTEIYMYGSQASSKAAALLAARENHGGDFLDYTFADLRSARYKERSSALAEQVEGQISEKLDQHFRNIQKARFYVLAHADMPAILVETAFISNKDEENKLRDPYWREKMAKAISDGILGYKDLVEGNVGNREAWR